MLPSTFILKLQAKFMVLCVLKFYRQGCKLRLLVFLFRILATHAPLVLIRCANLSCFHGLFLLVIGISCYVSSFWCGSIVLWSTSFAELKLKNKTIKICKLFFSFLCKTLNAKEAMVENLSIGFAIAHLCWFFTTSVILPQLLLSMVENLSQKTNFIKG